MPGSSSPRDVAVEAAEQLVAAADGEERRAALDRLAQRVRLRREVVRDERLLAVLAAADVEEVDLAGGHGVAACRSRRTSSSWPRAPRALGEHGDVAAVGVDVQVVGIEVADADLHAALLPVVRDVAARGDDLAQREHRGVGREDDELAAGRRQLEPAVERRARATGRPRSARAARPP